MVFQTSKIILFSIVVVVSFQDDSNSKVSNRILFEELKVLPTHAFKDYPSPMGWENSILIQGTNLSTIEPEAFLNVRVHDLDVIHNPLEVLSTQMFVNVSVRSLALNDNNIKSIQFGTFDKIYPYDKGSSFKLYLYGNRLESISRGLFNGLDIVDLYLQKNLIKSIEQGAFNHMPKLEFIHLAENRLETIGVGLFQNLGDDIHLILRNNKISFVDSGAFVNTTHLILNLKGNNVDMIKGYFDNSPDIIKFTV